MPETLASLLNGLFTALIATVPTRCAATFFELLIGTLQVNSPHLSSVIFYLGTDCHWTTYYWFIRKASWSWLNVLKTWFKVIDGLLDEDLSTFVIDDFVLFRSSDGAPEVKYHRDHAKKANRPKYVKGQSWLMLARIVQKDGRVGAVPLISRLMKKLGNPSKLKTAGLIAELAFPLLSGRLIRLLVDAWYTKGPLLLPLLERFPNLEIIGQARHDTALFYAPTAAEQPAIGRPRKYGRKVIPDELKTHSKRMTLYGKKQQVQYRSCICLARFLKGRKVRAVWMLLEDASKWRLLLSTNPKLSALEVMEAYNLRWKVEPTINDFKNRFGLLQAWQQTRQSLARWSTILTIAYGINKLVAILQPEGTKVITPIIPWRSKQPLTAGWIRLGMVQLFGHFCLTPESRQNFSRFYPQIVKELIRNGLKGVT
jgi:Transposase DDE domain